MSEETHRTAHPLEHVSISFKTFECQRQAASCQAAQMRDISASTVQHRSEEREGRIPPGAVKPSHGESSARTPLRYSESRMCCEQWVGKNGGANVR